MSNINYDNYKNFISYYKYNVWKDNGLYVFDCIDWSLQLH